MQRSEAEARPQHSDIEYSPLLVQSQTGSRETTTVNNESIKSRVYEDGKVTLACLGSSLGICLAPLQYGYHIAELNTPKGIITRCPDIGTGTLPLCLPMDDKMYSLATSIFAIGGLVGSLLAGWMAERWGRKGGLVRNNVMFLVGPILMALSVNPAMLIIGRFISGVGSGAAIVIAPLYLSEIAPASKRGVLNLLNQLSIVIGILIALTVSFVANTRPYWRLTVGFGIILSCFHIMVSPFILESPRYLWAHGCPADARLVLKHLRGTDDVECEVQSWGGPEDAGVASANPTNSSELGANCNYGVENESCLQQPLDMKQQNKKVTVLNIFLFPEYRKRWMLVLLLQFGQQLSGINTVFYYSSSVLEKMFSEYTSSILTMMIGVLNVVATASGALIIDRFGRRPLLFSSMAAMTVSIVLLGVGLGLNITILAAISLYLVVASFAPGYGPVPFLLGTEFFDVHAAGAGGSWALAANWMGTFIVAAAFLPVQNLIGEWVFSVFVSALILCGTVFYFYIPETKGRSIDEIARSFN